MYFSDSENMRILAEQLEDIRNDAMNGLYGQSLSKLEQLLTERPTVTEALRLKGNILELRALDFAQYRTEKLLRSRDYIDARTCYEKILELDPTNTLALADLGDHFKNLKALDKAVSYFTRAVELLKAGESRLEWREEVQEILDKFADLGGKISDGKLQELEETCRALLGRQ